MLFKQAPVYKSPWHAVNTGFSVTVDLKTVGFFSIGIASAFDVMRNSSSPVSLQSQSPFHPAPVARTHTFPLTARARDVNLGEKGAVLKLTVTYS